MITGPTIPDEEFRARLAAVQGAMAEHGLDALVLYGDDRAVFGANPTRWLLDYAAHFESCCVIVPAIGLPHVATGAEAELFYRNTARLGEVHVVRDFCMPDEEYPYTHPISFTEYVKASLGDLGRPVRKVGIVERLWAPEWLMDRWRENFPGAEIVPFDRSWYALKARKSPAELAVIAHAYQLAELGLAAGRAALAPGVSEREVAAEIEYVMRKAGTEGCGIDTIVGSGLKNTRAILTRAYRRVIEPGDLVLLTIAPRYEGYHSAIGRPFIVDGKATDEVAQASRAAIAAADAVVAALKPGASGAEVANAGLDVLRRAGVLEYCVYSGNHSVGTSEFEPPILTSTSDYVIHEDMVVSVDVPLFFAPWGGFRYEDGYQVTATGAVKLNPSPLEPLVS
jgi:Xaa-Pro aminopeptidase